MQAKSPVAHVWGTAASALCAVHCLATPLVLATLPAYIGQAWESPIVHQFFAAFIVVCCLSACIPGYLKHKDRRVPFIMCGGLSIILIALLLPEAVLGSWEIPLLFLGSLILVIGNIMNYRKVGSCCHPCSAANTTNEK